MAPPRFPTPAAVPAPHAKDPTAPARRRLPLPPLAAAAFVAAVVIVALIAALFYRSLGEQRASNERFTRSLDTIEQLQVALSRVKDAETGQRGYLLTGNELYLEPFNNARASLPGMVEALKRLIDDNPRLKQRADALQGMIDEKLAELDQTIAMVRAGNGNGAAEIVRSDRGRLSMDRIRALVADMVRDERARLAERQEEVQSSATTSAALVLGGCAFLLLFVLASAWYASRDHRSREDEAWIRNGMVGLAQSLQGERRQDVLAARLLAFLAGYVNAQVGAVYVSELGGAMRRVASFALPPGFGRAEVQGGEGLLGEASRRSAPTFVDTVPAGYLPVSSALGAGNSRAIAIIPAMAEEQVHAVVELGFFRRLDGADRSLLARVAEPIGLAMRSGRDRTRLEELLHETQRQAEELQTQQEELRVSNEELEEQGRSLKETTARLEEQRAELEQSNVQLADQASELEAQKDALAEVQDDLRERAVDLEQANRYKSEFLANMSHELRTPLNSTLILSKLLADNRAGNLDADQVRFADTIHSAGNDLLALINDILDLSKIEARKVELDIQPVDVRAALRALAQTMTPIATDRGLSFETRVADDVPASIATDAQRLAQILRNLVSNALKFTERGGVDVGVTVDGEGRVRFAVHDTGIGIAPAQHAVIFEAFRQADGSTHRKYGGTGLGLSISRDLAQLLGGDIGVDSEPGKGSTFTLVLPVAHAQAGDPPPPGADARGSGNGGRAARVTAQPGSARGTGAGAGTGTGTGDPARALSAVDDDREHLAARTRTMLVIEDDPAFAMILRDLAHEYGYQCVVTNNAREGLEAAVRYRPSAVVLDVNLPDDSGLAVLDRLKRDPELRPIPVHIVSVADYSREALARGAVGYALKPVARDKLAEAFRQIEARLAKGVRRVLVVEDDERQRDSIRRLLEMNDVEIVDARTAGDALARLREGSFDCVVMDLNLPDLSGYQLLERMAAETDIAFPPVIVYTGRSLTRDEEFALRRLANSIIIKGARSPERLLDEVTLFLHQVEARLPPERQRMLKAARDRDASLEGRRVLVAEDDVRNIFALTSVLEAQGVEVAVARNGREAIEALQAASRSDATPIDLVLMDIMMPEMDGLAAMREIRAAPEWRKLPIIALTAKAMPDDQAICLAAGASDYIAKPLDAGKLLSLVRVWMPRRTA